MTPQDSFYMQRCLELASHGLGSTFPNPLVGCVIVHNGLIIGEGWHRKAGEPHAEVLAIASVKNEALLPESTIYVSLEPCSHYGKTPPCANLIIAKKIKKVVIGTIDPFAKVAGNGIQLLKEAGCQVTLGVLEDKCNQLNKRFFTFHTKKRPYMILKWAQTQDGFIAPMAEKRENNPQPFWITNPYSRQLVHKWRTEEAAILIGTRTALEDNPKLNSRLWKGHHPVRIIIDRHLRIPKNYNVWDGSVKTLFITEKTNTPLTKNTYFHTIDFSKPLATQICDIAYEHHLQSLIIEGGTQTLNTFIEEALWDEARVFTGEKFEKKGVPAPKIQQVPDHQTSLLNDQIHHYYNT